MKVRTLLLLFIALLGCGVARCQTTNSFCYVQYSFGSDTNPFLGNNGNGAEGPGIPSCSTVPTGTVIGAYAGYSKTSGNFPHFAFYHTSFTVAPPQQTWTLQSSSNSPLAYPETAGDEYGSTAFTNCTPATPCPQPLIITYDTLNGVPKQLGQLLIATNSIDSGDGGVTSLTVASGTITVVNEDGGTYTFTGGPTNYTNSADGQPYTLTSMPSPTGTYTGTFAGPATATITLTVNSDFSVSATAALPALSLCPTQTTALNLTTSDPAAINSMGSSANVGGFISGDFIELSLADSLGNVTWMTASATDANGNPLAPGQLFFSGYSVSGACGGQYSWDAPFSKDGVKKPKGHGKHHHDKKHQR